MFETNDILKNEASENICRGFFMHMGIQREYVGRS